MEKILIIDDDEFVCFPLRRVLDKAQYANELVTDSRLAMDKIKEFKPDLVLLDIKMPHIDGISLLSEIRSQYDSIKLPVMMLTSYQDNSLAVSAFNQGANDFISKPIQFDILKARLRIHLNSRKFYLESLRKQELEAIKSMIITYNHEFNNPLAIAKGILEIMESKYPQAETYIEKMKTVMDRMQHLVMKISKIEKKEQIETKTYDNHVQMVKLD